MALITIDDVQSWVTTDRLQLEFTEDLPEETNISPQVLAVVSSRYDVSTWINPNTTPALIRSVISARVAAVRYRKVYADQLENEISYADWLEKWAQNTLDGIVKGTIPLLDVPAEDLVTAQTDASISFFPTDTTGIKFTMDAEF